MKKGFCYLIACLAIFYLQAQNNNYMPFISFASEGQAFAINNSTGIKAGASLKDSSNKIVHVVFNFVNPSTLDTLMISVKDPEGISVGLHSFSPKSSFVFFYKIRNKGLFLKLMKNEKNEITKGNSLTITKLENKAGGIIEGVFSFTDVPFRDINNQIGAGLKWINNGFFSTTINDDVFSFTKKQKDDNKSLPITTQNTSENTKLNQANDNTTINAGAALLFRNQKTKITNKEMNEIYAAWGYRLSKDKTGFTDKDNTTDHSFIPTVEIEDLNNDGIEEVFFFSDDERMFGRKGNTDLFIKDKTGHYKLNVSVMAPCSGFGQNSHNGFKDLEFQSMITSEADKIGIWRWNGTTYEYYKSLLAEDNEHLEIHKDTFHVHVESLKTSYGALKPYPGKTSLLNLIKIFIPDSSATQATAWNTGSGTNSPVKWQTDYVSKIDSFYDKKGDFKSFDGKTKPLDFKISLNSKKQDGYSAFSVSVGAFVGSGTYLNIKNLLGLNGYTATLIKKCTSGYSECRLFEIKITGKKTVWAITSFFGNQESDIHFYLNESEFTAIADEYVCEGERTYYPGPNNK